MRELRAACEAIAERARHVRVERDQIPLYAVSLTIPPRLSAANAPGTSASIDAERPTGADRERLAAFWLTLDAINFGSGWFPTLRKRQGRSGYYTIATGLRERFEEHGPWSAAELTQLSQRTVARTLGQDPDHELMALFASSLRDLGAHLADGFAGSFARLVDCAHRSAVDLATTLGEWSSFADSSSYDGLTVPFLKRAQIAAADLARANVAEFTDLDQLTMFADNLVPHVLRIDGILNFDQELVERIDRGELIEHGSREEVEIRACAVHAVELIVAARPRTCAADIDELLWHRGQDARYKASLRHRSRCTAY